jgi:hypothetical protein
MRGRLKWARGGEISGSAERALLIDNRKNVIVEHVQEPLYGDHLHAGMAVGEGLRLQEQHQPDDVGTDRFTGAAGVRHHQVVLELRELVGENRYVAQGTEAGRDSVQGPFRVFHFGIQVGAALFNGGHRLRTQFQFSVVVQDGLDFSKAQMFF